MSTVSQAKPARAMNRAAVMLPRDSQVPTAGCVVGLPMRTPSVRSARRAAPLEGLSVCVSRNRVKARTPSRRARKRP